jgi:superfamily I DNA and/or RNA helicase
VQKKWRPNPTWALISKLVYGDQRKYYLYNFIDLLIVDEAGQVSPEIAAGAFSLARKSVVVGDIYQIEPVWGVNRALAQSCGAIQRPDEFERLERTGLNCSSSSVMKVAAKCCKYEKFGEKGMLLREHRRCYDEIIQYCNELVYRGNLLPLRGKGSEDSNLPIKHWPQMGYRQIDTEHSTRKGNSRINPREAEQIAAWLKSHVKLIVDAYPKEAKENLVGVITPFKAQVACIREKLKEHLPNDQSKTSVGTVHTFQGAERRIIILSTVYGKQDGCYFIDLNKSLMNVAVSRAKDHFFVFGDIHCLKDTTSSASGLLKKHLIGNEI